MTDRGLLLCLYADRDDATAALRRLRAAGYRRTSLLHRRADGTVAGQDAPARPRAVLVTLAGALAAILAAAVAHAIAPDQAATTLLAGLAAGVAGGGAGWRLARRYEVNVRGTVLGDLSRWLLPTDTAVVVEADPADLDRAMEAARADMPTAPAIFVLLPELAPAPPGAARPAAPLSVAQLQTHARRLAQTHRLAPNHGGGEPLLDDLAQAEAVLEAVRRRLADAARLEQTMSVSAEWILDNAYIVRSHIADVRRNLAASFYHELPLLAGGAGGSGGNGAGPRGEPVPRVFALAQELVEHTEAHADRESVEAFLEAYQEIAPLTIGELWAMPLMLRIALALRLEGLAADTQRRLHDRELANLCANRLLVAARTDPSELFAVLAELARVVPEPSAHFGTQLTGHLYDEDSALVPVRTWLERKLHRPLGETITSEQAREAAVQVAIGNTITSLRRLSQMDWTKVFERVSAVERELRGDPAGAYAAMDFDTRDRYRGAVERLARRAGVDQEEVARLAVTMAGEQAADEGELYPSRRHVGTFLIGPRAPELAARLGVRPAPATRLRAAVQRHHAAVYVSAVTAMTLLLLVPVAAVTLVMGAHRVVAGLFLLAAVLPASELAVQLVNYLVTRLMPPRVLAKMDYERDGLPDALRTLVVVPTILADERAVAAETRKLLSRYLANPDANLVYALYGDYADADQRSVDADEAIVRTAEEAIGDLNRRYGAGRFYYLHRERDWCPTEGRYIGWERKRGKLTELNALISGAPIRSGPAIVRVGDPERLADVRFVITLDSDTQLPRDTARRLVETMAHPLNQAHAGGRRPTGQCCTIVQPRVSTSLPSATASRFTRLFTGAEGSDPYTRAVSDVYQDLAAEATYHGKGIYDPRAFHARLEGRFPEGRILSHDLIEGAHVGVGLASDIELLDEFPPDYVAYALRQHRWIRGDWQIAEWCLPWVRRPDGRWARNDLTAINRWKVLDNLRRSLVPVSSVAFLLTSWSAGWVAGAVAGVLLALGALLIATLQLAGEAVRSQTRAARSRAEMARQLTRTAVETALLPHQAGVALDAIARVAYRRLVSKRHLLQWTSAQRAARGRDAFAWRFLAHMSLISLLAVAAAATLAWLNREALLVAAPFLVLWFASPAIAWRLVGRAARHRPPARLTEAERTALRQVARRTWRYFDDFVGPQTHWLPPDNYQVSHQDTVAQRTSPTNIGLWLLSALSAADLGYLTPAAAVERLSASLRTMRRLERHEGHLLNWYELEHLRPLPPRYVSAVDSGNLLACLWALDVGLADLLERPLVDAGVLTGLLDTHGLLSAELERPGASRDQRQAAARLGDLIGAARADPARAEEGLAAVAAAAARLRDDLAATEDADPRAGYWAAALATAADQWHGYAAAHAPRSREGEDGGIAPDGAPPSWPSPRALAGEVAAAAELVRRTEELRQIVRELADAMSLRPLYDAERRLFAIGFNVDEGRLDASRYDLLASEARLGSFVAIARGDVPAEHWLAMSRPYRLVGDDFALLSWSGSMFEYLMPHLLQRSHENSLLHKAAQSAVAAHIAYAERRGVPWGISESAFSDLDAARTYQYQAFGVPDLGLKRGLGDDLVVAPYATLLALEVAPQQALANLRLHEQLGMLDDYGFFESIDFRRQRRRGGERGVLVRAYMAHHQGMGLLALVNALCDGVMRERFHRDPRVQATESLLYERVPVEPPLQQLDRPSRSLAILATEVVARTVSRFDTPHTDTVKTQLLSNGRYSLLVTGTGGGYSRRDDVDITRWRSDTTCDPYGLFCYIRDVDSGRVWSTAYQPVRAEAERYEALFALDRAEIRRSDDGIESDTAVVVSPEDDVEIRRITLINRSSRRRRLSLTSYVELALASHRTDRQHPAFGKLFVKTEALPDEGCLLAHRRSRHPDEAGLWVGHRMTLEGPAKAALAFETDRARFIGRGGSLADPAGLHAPLSGSQGFTLDPVFCLRRQLVLPPGSRASVALVLGAADTRAGVRTLMDKYGHAPAIDRALELAWARAQLELRQLRLEPDEARRFQQLASYMLYPNKRLRPPPERLVQSRRGQTALWAYGISGDLPIAVVTVGDERDIGLVRQLVLAHSYWRQRGLKADLVVLNEQSSGYAQPLQDQLTRLVQGHAVLAGVDRPGGVFVRSVDQMHPDDVTLLLTVAHVVLVAARGTLGRQLGVPREAPEPARPLSARHDVYDPARPLPYIDVQPDNGLGGFQPGGREYVITLGAGRVTPAPWSNVIANPTFGTLVTESGGGFTWSLNSQRNRLTQWSNDPVSDPPSEVVYVRDEVTGEFWTLTPAPVRENLPYRIRHGAGYTSFAHNSHGIEGELTVCVPMDDEGGLPLRTSLVWLRNDGRRARRLTLTFYAVWVLGESREESAMHVQTYWDEGLGALLARNRFNTEFGDRVAFSAVVGGRNVAYTGDRGEFLDRNGCLDRPRAMRHKGLSGNVGPALDPCAVLQVEVELGAGESATVAHVLGQAGSVDEVRGLLARLPDEDAVAERIGTTRQWWDRLLGGLEVDLPDSHAAVLVNRWLPYQTLSARVWGRTGFYQSSGAYGFRDQLQDVIALLPLAPEIAREHILLAARHQFPEGDVLHWWHPPGGAGVRTRISDDLLWLPWAAAEYVAATGDHGILDVMLPFVQGRALEPWEQEAYVTPEDTVEHASLYDHCERALRTATTAGPHGLPLFGAGDWNDGMNRVGEAGRGESVWLAWFLSAVLQRFADECAKRRDPSGAARMRAQAAELAARVEAGAWDGDWYLRGWFDDGTPLGGRDCPEARIDSLPQSWAVLGHAADRERALRALESAWRHLVRPDDGLALLFTPPFDTWDVDPGYIRGYPPGVRENGGQYTHAAMWLALAAARAGWGGRAVELLRLCSPVTRSADEDGCRTYGVEPYVKAADVYSLEGRVGRGGWTWYTGAAGWAHRAWVQGVLGLRLEAGGLTVDPAIPAAWPGFTVRYRHGASLYVIEVRNPDGVERGVAAVELDGRPLPGGRVELVDDGAKHHVLVRLGAGREEAAAPAV